MGSDSIDISWATCTLSGATWGGVATLATTGAVAGGLSGAIYGGTLESTLKGAAYGGISGGIGGAFAGSGAWGNMIGGGINGYLQTGTAEGFTRGFAAGAIPQDLGFTNAYLNNPVANIGIGIVRDGIRGGIVADSRNGIGPGIAYGQVNNTAGHLWGAVSSSFSTTPRFNNGAFYYPDSKNYGASFNYGAITFGNVIIGNGTYVNSLTINTADTCSRWLDNHERGHIAQAGWMGAAYLPLQATSQWTGTQIFEFAPFHSLGYETRPYQCLISER